MDVNEIEAGTQSLRVDDPGVVGQRAEAALDNASYAEYCMTYRVAICAPRHESSKCVAELAVICDCHVVDRAELAVAQHSEADVCAADVGQYHTSRPVALRHPKLQCRVTARAQT